MMNKSIAFLTKLGLEPFVICLLMAIALAYAYPYIGIDHPYFSLGSFANFGVSAIFLFYGIKMDFSKLKIGLKNYKLHILIQCATFIFFPILVLFLMFLFGVLNFDGEINYLWLGIFFLAALPSTVSSSVVMVSLAGGNVISAIFNATISTILGVIITPIWLAIFLNNADENLDVFQTLFKLFLQVLVPILIGIALNKKYSKLANKNSKALKLFDQFVIILIVYTSFCQSFYDKRFDGFSLSEFAQIIALVLIIFFTIYLTILSISKALKFSLEDEITAVFCGSKKSLVQGSVMAKVMFEPSVLGIIILPIMIYHSLQLIIVSIIANFLASVKGRDLPLGK